MKNIIKSVLGLVVFALIVSSCDKSEIETAKQSDSILKDHITISVEDPEDVIDRLCYDPRNVNPFVICPANIDPVCACGVITFGNACTAGAYGFQNVTKGSCLEQKCYSAPVKRALYTTLHCSEEPDYVCGCNNITYKNECEALRNGVLVTTPGRCEYGTEINIDSLIENGCFNPDNIDLITNCPDVIDPVCACGVIQFSNACGAESAGFQNYERGSCVSNRCKSETVRNLFRGMGMTCAPGPDVCGCDGKTYNSGCHALMNGVLAWTPGACGAIINSIDINKP